MHIRPGLAFKTPHHSLKKLEPASHVENSRDVAKVRKFAIAAADSALRVSGLALSAGQNTWFVTTLSLVRTAIYQGRSVLDLQQRTPLLHTQTSAATSLRLRLPLEWSFLRRPHTQCWRTTSDLGAPAAWSFSFEAKHEPHPTVQPAFWHTSIPPQ